MYSVYSRHIFEGGGGFPAPKKITISPQKTAAELCAINVLFGRDNELQIYRRNFLSVDNKHGKLFAIKQPKGWKFMPKMHQIIVGGRALAELMRSPRPLAATGAYF